MAYYVKISVWNKYRISVCGKMRCTVSFLEYYFFLPTEIKGEYLCRKNTYFSVTFCRVMNHKSDFYMQTHSTQSIPVAFSPSYLSCYFELLLLTFTIKLL